MLPKLTVNAWLKYQVPDSKMIINLRVALTERFEFETWRNWLKFGSINAK